MAYCPAGFHGSNGMSRRKVKRRQIRRKKRRLIKRGIRTGLFVFGLCSGIAIIINITPMSYENGAALYMIFSIPIIYMVTKKRSKTELAWLIGSFMAAGIAAVIIWLLLM